MDFKDFKDSLGKPNEGFHKERIHIFGLSLSYNDFIGTIFLGLILCLFVGIPIFISLELTKLMLFGIIIYWTVLFIFSVIVMFSFGILLHYMFRVNTVLNKVIFGEIF